MPVRLLAILVLVGLLGTAVPGESQSPVPPSSGPSQLPSSEIAAELVTDRPDFTESSEIISRGVAQFESGIALVVDTSEEVRSSGLLFPRALLRLGLGHRTELRLGGEGFLSERTAGVTTSGYSDIEFGLKVRLLDQAGAGIDASVIPAVSLPTGSSEFSSGGADPSLKFTWARSLPGDVGLTGNVNVASLSDGSGRFVQYAATVSIGRALARGWAGFVEGYAFSPMRRRDATGATLDFGLTRLIGRDAQFDVEAGRGLTTAAPDWFIGAGFAIRGRFAQAR